MYFKILIVTIPIIMLQSCLVGTNKNSHNNISVNNILPVTDSMFKMSNDSTIEFADAVLEKDFDKIRLFLSSRGKRSDNINFGDKEHFVPLIFAIGWGLDDVAYEILSRNINLEISDKEGNTALSVACERGKVQLVKLLVKKGVKINRKEAGQKIPLIQTLRSIYVSNDEKRYEITKFLIENGAETNVRDIYGMTALFCACKYDKLVDLLLKSGADVNLSDTSETWIDFMIRRGLSAIHIAVIFGSKEVVELLLQNGADINAKDYHGWTPLHFASYYMNTEMIGFLEEKGADINIVTTKNYTLFITGFMQPEYPANSKPMDFILISATNYKFHN